MDKIKYHLNYVDIEERFGIRISSSKGILSRPASKKTNNIEWPDYHGEIIDTEARRIIESRAITLNGWLYAGNRFEFVTKWNEFISLFNDTGTTRLMISVHPTHPLVYEVQLNGEIDIEKRWRTTDMGGTFSLKLKEPNPVKRVISVENANTLGITMHSDKIVNISWGDGTTDYDLQGDIDITHSYDDTERHIAIIMGVIEEIENFSTTGSLLWNII